MIDVIVADDSNLLRWTVCRILENADGIEVIAEAGDGQVALELVERLAPDVLVLDVSMPNLNGVQICERLGALGTRTGVVMFSGYAEEYVVREALRKGAKGYVLKGALAMRELILAVRAVGRGETYLSSRVSHKALDEQVPSSVLSS